MTYHSIFLHSSYSVLISTVLQSCGFLDICGLKRTFFFTFVFLTGFVYVHLLIYFYSWFLHSFPYSIQQWFIIRTIIAFFHFETSIYNNNFADHELHGHANEDSQLRVLRLCTSDRIINMDVKYWGAKLFIHAFERQSNISKVLRIGFW